MPGLSTLVPDRAMRWIIVIALTGLILRIHAAAGGLWSDEAWSAVLAGEVTTPLGIFMGINHDNNHHLNSLWLQTVGLSAPPLVARALSVLAGTASIVLAGMIGARRSPVAGVVTALLFALSPVLVTLGSEARGYAPMTLCVLVALWHIDRFLSGDAAADRPVTLALCFFVGALFQLTMIFAACALTGWLALALWRRDGFRVAVATTLRLLGPALLALAAAVAIVFAPSVIGGAEFRFGAKQDFTILQFLRGLIDLLDFMVGIQAITFWVPAGAAILVVLARSIGTPRLPFYWLAIIAFPLTVAALHLINAGHGRYYLLAGLALLLLLGEAVAALLKAGGWWAGAAALGLFAFSGVSVAANIDLIHNQRGDPGAAIRALAARAPGGATVMIDRETGLALLRVAAAQAGYKLAVTTGCPAGRYVFVDWWRGENDSPGVIARCGVRYRMVVGAMARGMSGQNWALYELT